jgi:hypothetical protein
MAKLFAQKCLLQLFMYKQKLSTATSLAIKLMTDRFCSLTLKRGSSQTSWLDL